MNLVAINPQNLGKILKLMEKKNNLTIVGKDGHPFKCYKYNSPGSPVKTAAKEYIKELVNLSEECGKKFVMFF